MAITNGDYPKVQLLDNENNPISPLVDICSIYANVSSKEDAGVFNGITEDDVLDSSTISISDADFLDEEGNGIYMISKLESDGKHNIKVQRVNLIELLDMWYRNYILTTHYLYEKNSLPLSDSDNIMLESESTTYTLKFDGDTIDDLLQRADELTGGTGITVNDCEITFNEEWLDEFIIKML